MSFWRNYVKMTSFWRKNDVIITSCIQGDHSAMWKDLGRASGVSMAFDDVLASNPTPLPSLGLISQEPYRKCKVFAGHRKIYSHERHGVSSQRQNDYFFNSLFRLTTNKSESSNPSITGPLCWESIDPRWIPLHKGTNNAVKFPWRHNQRNCDMT